MPKTVQVPNLGVVEFPDEMSDDDIGAQIKKHGAQQEDQYKDLFTRIFQPPVPKGMEGVAGPSPLITQPYDSSKGVGAPEGAAGSEFKSALAAAMAYAGNIARSIPADVAATLSGRPGEFGGNVLAALHEQQMPIDVAFAEAAKEEARDQQLGLTPEPTGPSAFGAKMAEKLTGRKPTIEVGASPTTEAKIAQSAAATAPLLIVGGLPAWGQRLVAAGFSAKMIYDAPELARQLGTELGKPPEQRDPDKLTTLYSEAVQTGFFAPTAGAFAARGKAAIPETPEPTKEGAKYAVHGETEKAVRDVRERPEAVKAGGQVPAEGGGEKAGAPRGADADTKTREVLLKSELPDWVREEMQRRGLSPGRTFNDIDLGNPSVRDAISSDPTLSEKQKQSLLETGALPEAEKPQAAPAETAPKEKAISDFNAAVADLTQRAPPTEAAEDAGMKAKTVDDLDALLKARQDLVAAKDAALKKVREATTPEAQTAAMNDLSKVGARTQLPREAIEAATNAGSQIEGKKSFTTRVLGERPLDWRKNPEIKQWLLDHGEEMWGKDSLGWENFQKEAAEHKPAEAPLEVESVTALDPQTGQPLSATESLLRRLETPRPPTGKPPVLTREEPKTVKEFALDVNEAGDITKASIPERVVTSLEEYANRARQRLNERLKRTYFGAGPLHELPNIRDFAIIGAAKLARGTLDFAKWSAEMINEHGPRITAWLPQIWDQAKQMVEEMVTGEASKKTEIQKIIERGVGIGRRMDVGEQLGLKIPAEKVEKLTGVKQPPQKEVTVGEKTALKEVLSKAEEAGEAGRKAGAAEARAEAKTIIQDLRERLADSVSKFRAMTEYFRGQEKGGAAGRAAATKEFEMANRWLDADVENIRKSLIKLANMALPLSERGRFLNAITQAMQRPPFGGDVEGMYRKAAEVAAKIEDRANEVQKSDTIAEIKKTVERAIASPSVDIDYKNKILSAMKRISFTRMTGATEARLKATREYMQRSGVESLPDEVISELNLLTKIPAKDLPLNVLQAMLDRVEMLEKLGRLKVRTRQAIWDAEKVELGSEMSDSQSLKIEQHPELRPQPGEKTPFSLRLRNYINRRLNSIGTIDRGISPRDVMHDLMDGARATYDGFISRVFGGRIDSAFNRTIVRRNEILDPIQEFGEQQRFTDQDYERIGAYAVMQQEGGRQRLIDNGASPEVLDKIQQSMRPNELEMYRMMRGAMDGLLPEVQSLMKNLYNIEVHPVENYFPFLRDWRLFKPEREAKPMRAKPGAEVEFDDLAAWKTLEEDYVPRRTTQAERGFTKERLPEAATPIKIHALDIFMRHIQDVSHLLETQRDLKMLGEIARHESFLKQYGSVGQKFMLDWLDTVAKQGGTESFRRLAILDILRRNTTLGVIGFRLGSQFVHLANIPLAMNQVGAGWYFNAAREVLSGRAQKFVKEHFAETYARAGAEPAIQEAPTTLFGTIPIGALQRWAFYIVKNIDRLNSQATALGAYMRVLSEKGIDPATYADRPVDVQARNKALILARRAVASPLPKDVPQALSRGAITGGNVSIGRALFQFQNVFLDQWSAIRHDLVRAGFGHKNLPYAATTLAALGGMLLLETGIKMGMTEIIHGVTGYQPKNPTTFEEKLAHEALRRFPFLGNVLAMAMYGETGVPMIDTLVQIGKAAGKAATAKTEKTKTKAAIQATSGVLQIMGVPGASQIGEIVEKSQ